MSGRVPEDLRTDDLKMLGLLSDEVAASDAVKQALVRDLRFEHLSPGEAKDAVWRFVCESHLRRRRLVAGFVERYEREPTDHTCFFPIEWLTVEHEVELPGGLRLLSADSVEVPGTGVLPDPRPTMGSVLAVPCAGTSHERMRDRARELADHVLRVLRVALREDHFVHDRQLRFRLGETAWFEDGTTFWSSRDDLGWDLALREDLIELARSQEIAQLPAEPASEVEERANLALVWFERAQLETEQTTQLLFLFFALETLLGDRSAGEKATPLALRRATLEMVTGDGSFSHPARAYLLYDKVRSDAVHGEEAPLVSDDDLIAFAWSVRRGINQFLRYARAEGFTRRSRVTDALDQHERCRELIDWLLEQDPDRWKNLRRREEPRECI
jgi:hypothetical protein